MTRLQVAFGTAVLTAPTSFATAPQAGPCGFRLAFSRPDEGGAATVNVFVGNPAALTAAATIDTVP